MNNCTLKNLETITTKTLDLLIQSVLLFDIKTALNEGRGKRMINCHTCSHKCHIVRQAISDPRLKSICLLLLRQSNAIKRELCLSGLIQLTGGDNNRKWMWLFDRLRVISVQPRAQTHVSVNVWSARPFTAILLTSINEQKVSLWKQGLFLLYVFVYCSGVVVLVSHSRCWKDLGEGFEKSTLSAIQTWDHTNRWIPSASWCVLCDTGTHTLYIHIGIHHTNKLERTHHSQKSNTCTGPALEPQQSAAVLMGATCCYCGLCGKAGLLPALQPAATEWTQYPDSGSHGPQASGPPPACLPACPAVSAAFNHSSFWLQVRGHLIQCKSVSCSKDATHRACHWAREDSPMCLWQEAENQADITTLLPSSQIDRYKSVFAPFSAAAWVNKTVSSWFTVTKLWHFTQIFKTIQRNETSNMLTCCRETAPKASLS